MRRDEVGSHDVSYRGVGFMMALEVSVEIWDGVDLAPVKPEHSRREERVGASAT